MMLSRAAERVYWSGRYLERAESIARIVQQYSQLLLDLPDEVGVDWYELVRIFGARDAYMATGAAPDESNILDFLLADRTGSTSLFYALRSARDNIRNLRDILPIESWESVNELYQFANRRLNEAAGGEDRFEVLSQCINRCQQVNASLHNTMSHRSPFRFLMIGQGIERADMTSRVIDVAASYSSKNEEVMRRYGSPLWIHVLKTVGGFQMYRQYVQWRVNIEKVVEFLVNDADFPRSVRFCIEMCIENVSKLPRPEEATASLERLRDSLNIDTIDTNDPAAVSTAMDALQGQLAAVHGAVARTWFLPELHA
jgi:uncharacterized alpha-E superfamily protein